MDNKTEDINIKQILMPYLRKWYWFIISAFLALVIGVLFIKRQQNVFNVQSTVLIKDSKSNDIGGEFAMLSDLSAFGSLGSDGVENEIEIFKSKKLMKEVVENLNLESNVYIKERFKNKEVYGNENPFEIKLIHLKEKEVGEEREPIEVLINGDKLTFIVGEKKIFSTFNKTVKLPYATLMVLENKNYDSKVKHSDLYIDLATVEDRVVQYQDLLFVDLVNKGTTVLKLSINYPVVKKGKDILNQLVKVYNEDALEDKNFSGKKSADFIDERIEQVGRDLGMVEDEKQHFKQSNNITDLPTEAEINLQSNADAKKKELELESELDLTTTLLTYAQSQGIDQTLPANIGLSNPGAVQSITTYNQLVLERNRYLQNATEDNPIVKDITKQINNLRPSIINNLTKHKQGLELAKSIYQAEQSKNNSRIAKIPAQEKRYRSLERKQQIKENLYLLLLQKKEENEIAMSIAGQKARVIDEAFVNKQVAPKKMVILVASLLFGLLIPVVCIYLRNLLDNKIKTKHDLEKILRGKTILGEIPSVDKGQDEYVRINDLSPLAEAFRIMNTNLNFMLPKNRSKVIYVTSTIKGEGKTFVAANLALILANRTRKVVIIGADIRNPQLQRFNNNGKDFLGLSEYLYGDNYKLGDIIQKSSINGNLDVIYSGIIPPNPTDLLSNGKFSKMLNELKVLYDYIIVDTAPLMLVTDTFLIADYADTFVYVTRSLYTEKQLIEFANNQVDTGKIKNVGFVINGVKKAYLGYGNKYGYGYGVDNRSFFQKLLDKLNFRN